MKTRHSPADPALLVLALLLSAGTAWLFPTCGPTESGAWMRCHWAGQAVIGTGIAALALSVACLAVPWRSVRAGLSMALVPVGILAVVIPNGWIGVCDGAAMQCRAVTLPAVTILGTGICALGAVNACLLLRAELRQKLQRGGT